MCECSLFGPFYKQTLVLTFANLTGGKYLSPISSLIFVRVSLYVILLFASSSFQNFSYWWIILFLELYNTLYIKKVINTWQVVPIYCLLLFCLWYFWHAYCFCFHVASLCLLVEAFNPFTFKINMFLCHFLVLALWVIFLSFLLCCGRWHISVWVAFSLCCYLL